VSLDAPSPDDGSTFADGPWLGSTEPGFGRIEARSDLRDALARLSADERELIRLRFIEGMSQQELSDLLGLSQSYVSRVIRRLLDRLEADLDPEARRRRLARGARQSDC
jgi:RNA polymerase sigma-B factor